MIWQMAQGKAPDCHCFGAIHSEPVSPKSLIRNAVFAILALFLVAQGRENQGLGFTDLTNEMAIQLIIGLATIGMLGAVVFFLKRISEQQTQIMRRIEVLELISTSEGGEVKRDEAGSVHDGLPLGAPFPDFALADLNGKIVEFDHLLGTAKPTLFFFVSPTCNPCKALLPEIETWQTDLKNKLQIVFVSSGTADENLEKFGGAGSRQILLQNDRELAEATGAKWTPTALLVNADGAIASNLAVGDAAIRELIGKIKAKSADEELLFITNGTPTKIGETAPPFALNDIHGKEITENYLRGKRTIVAFWNPTCPFCVSMLDELREWDKARSADDPDLLLISSGDAAVHEKFDLNAPIVLDDEQKTAADFGMNGTPSAVLVDENGKIISETAVGAQKIWALLGKKK
jgi:peroxiredoxin